MSDTGNTGSGQEPPSREPAEREDIEMLLPWYVTGRLDVGDRGKVEDYLARHPEMAAQLDLIAEERFQATLANEAIVQPSPAALDRLLGDIAASGRPARPASSAGFLDRVRGFFTAPTSGAVQWAAAIAVVVLVAQTVAIGSLVMNQPGGARYETASGGAADTTAGTFALVQFRSSVSAAELAAKLIDLDVAIVDGPKPGGLYRVRIASTALSAVAREQRLAMLRSRSELFLLVTPSK